MSKELNCLSFLEGWFFLDWLSSFFRGKATFIIAGLVFSEVEDVRD
jgi:hypothetical protein